MNEDQIYKTLQKVFDETFLDEINVTADLSAHDVAEWDSLTHISLIVHIEKAFQIRFQTGELDQTQNMGELVAVIKRHLSA